MSAEERDRHETRKDDASGVTVVRERAAWEDYLSRRSDATLFHDARWGEVFQEVYGNRPHYLSARRGGQTVGVLQLVAKRSLLFGSHLCSLPYFDASGILADDGDAREALIREAQRLREDQDVGWVELRQEGSLGEAYPVRTDKVTVRVALPPTADALWDRLKPKVRNQVRKAEKEGLTVEKGGGGLLDEFYAVYLRNMRDLGSPAHSPGLFRRIAARFAEVVRVFAVRSGSDCVAASLTLRDVHGVYVPWAGSDWRVRDLCGNMLLYWAMLSDACEGGAPMFDFGRGTVGSGTHRFKVQWGGEEVPLHWHYLLPEGARLPEVRYDSPRYRLAEACWRRLPLGVTRVLGPRIIRKLS